jgi:hypothetical protein
MPETIQDTTLSLSDIRERVYYLAKESSGSSLFPCTEVTDIINSALARVFGAVNYQYSVIYRNTSCSVEGYMIPDAKLVNGNAVVDSVWIDDEPLTAVAYTEWDNCTDTYATPTDFWVSGNVIHLYPIPDAPCGCVYQMKIRYRPEFQKLVACTDTPHLSDLMIDAAVYYAVHLMKAKDEEFASADYFKRLYDETIAEVAMIPPGLYSSSTTYGGAA